MRHRRALHRRGTVWLVAVAAAGCTSSPSASVAEAPPPLLVGDSIGFASRAAFTAQGWAVDADPGRSAYAGGFGRPAVSGWDAVSRAAATPARIWIVQIGTNDLAAYDPDRFGTFVADVVAHTKVGCLVGVVPWQREQPEAGNVAAMSRQISDGIAAHRRADVHRWDEVAAADPSLVPDGVHPGRGRGEDVFVVGVIETVARTCDIGT